MRKRILFVCEGNVGRSPMAEAMFNLEATGGLSARSAGTEPSASPSPLVIRAMDEIGIDISSHRARQLDRDHIAWGDLVIVVGATNGLPRGLDPVQWPLARIKDEPIEVVRRVRDEIRLLVAGLLQELNPSTDG